MHKITKLDIRTCPQVYIQDTINKLIDNQEELDSMYKLLSEALNPKEAPKDGKGQGKAKTGTKGKK